MNLSLRVCALLATLVAVLGLSGRLAAKPPDLPVNDPPVVAPKDGPEEASPPPAGGAIRYSQPPASVDPADIMVSPLIVDVEAFEKANKLLVNQPSPPQVDWTAGSSGPEAPEMAIKLLVLRQPWKSPQYRKAYPPEQIMAGTSAVFISNRQQALLDPVDFYSTETCEQLARDVNAAAVNRLPTHLLVLKQPWCGSSDAVKAEGKDSPAQAKKQVVQAAYRKKAPCAPPKPADKDGFTCPYLKQQAADRHAAMIADPQVSEDVLSNLDKLEAAQSLIEAADKLQHAGRRAEALHCLSLVQKLCPGSRCAAEAADKAARLAKTQMAQSGSDEAADEREARPQTKGCSPVYIGNLLDCLAVRSVRFFGNSFVSSGRLSRVVKSSARLSELSLEGFYNPEQVTADVRELVKYYHRFGFFDAQVEPHDEYATDGKGIHLTFLIEEGKRYRIAKAPKIVGNIQACPPEQLAAYSTVKPGSYYSQDAIQLDKKKIEAWYGYRGQKVTVKDHRVFDKEKPGTVKVQYEIRERPVDKVGEIQVIGNTRTRYDYQPRQAPVYPDQAKEAAATPEPGVEVMVRGLMKACRLAVADHRQEQAVELARQAQVLDPRSVLADPVVYRMAQLAGKPQKKEPVSCEESSCPACPRCTTVQVRPLAPCCPCLGGGIVEAFEQLLEEAEHAAGQSGEEPAKTPAPVREPIPSSTCPAEQHQAGSEEKSEMSGGLLGCVQHWLDGQEHGTLMLGVGLDEQLRLFVRCNLTLGDQVYHLDVGRGWPALWTTPNAAVAARKPAR